MTRRNPMCAALALTLLAFATQPSTASAARAEPSAGKVALTARALPGKKGDKVHLRALDRNARGRAVFREDPVAGGWKIHYAASVRQPMRDLTIKIFDVTRGQRLIGTRGKMLFAESRIVTGSLTLDRDEVFDPNARLLVVFEAPDGAVLARRVFYIQGRAETYSGTVEFDAEDTAGDSEELTAESVRVKKRRN